uniref:Uncharacterized protein n=1 Tax=Arundo donax TaxID=35708 RepID=A0A0A9BS05_ARUDO
MTMNLFKDADTVKVLLARGIPHDVLYQLLPVSLVIPLLMYSVPCSRDMFSTSAAASSRKSFGGLEVSLQVTLNPLR